MATKVTMPQLGESVVEGTIGKWLVSVVQSVAKDEPIVEPARPLFDIQGYARTFDVTADGQRFLMIRLGEDPTGNQINVTLDWAEASQQ